MFWLLLLFALPAYSFEGQVVDSESGKPIAGAIVTAGEKTTKSDEAGKFDTGEGEIGIRACGYGRLTVLAKEGMPPVALTPLRPRALYLSYFGIGNKKLREAAIELIEKTRLNALVIDVKGDRGRISLPTSLPLAAEIGAQKTTTIKDARALVNDLHRRKIYAIARIVVFKDDLLATARPALAVKRADGTIWRDRENLAWADPFSPQVWDYDIDVAIEAARAGFDEIQFDYLRFPDASGGLVFSQKSSEESRVGAIGGFLSLARKRLTPYNVFIAADIFGYVLWNKDDTHIGQRLEDIAPLLDYLSPMLYPSGFQFGIPGFENPVKHPREIVSLSLKRAQKRTGLSPLRFRPWLQSFRDYAFDKTPFGDQEIRAQIEAAEDFGSDGWMLWNPRNNYSNAGQAAK